VNPADISAVLVTRGDCDMTRIVDSIKAVGVKDIVIWNNSQRRDEGIFGRYAAIAEAKHDIVIAQDDDVIVKDWDTIINAYTPNVLTVSYPEPYDIPWLAAGSIFDSDLPRRAFARYLKDYEYDYLFTHRICDAVFALLTETNVIDVGYEDLPIGYQQGRVSTSGGWYDRDRPEAQRRCKKIIDSEGVPA
jgi:hypothetical protein